MIVIEIMQWQHKMKQHACILQLTASSNGYCCQVDVCIHPCYCRSCFVSLVMNMFIISTAIVLRASSRPCASTWKKYGRVNPGNSSVRSAYQCDLTTYITASAGTFFMQVLRTLTHTQYRFQLRLGIRAIQQRSCLLIYLSITLQQ